MKIDFNPTIMYANYQHLERGYCLEIERTQSRLLLWCTNGKGLVTINNKEKVELKPNKCILTPFNFKMKIVVDEAFPLSLAAVHIIPDMKRGSMSDFKVLCKGQEMPHHKNRFDADIEELGKSLCDFYIDYYNHTSYLINHIITWFASKNRNYTSAKYLAKHLLLELISYKKTEWQKEELIDTSYPLELRKLITKIDWEHNSDITVQTLLDISLCSRANLFRLFKKHLNLTPVHWILGKKIKHSMRLLKTSNLLIKEIAAMAGFQDPYYFAKVFKKINNMTPTEYRKKFEF